MKLGNITLSHMQTHVDLTQLSRNLLKSPNGLLVASSFRNLFYKNPSSTRLLLTSLVIFADLSPLSEEQKQLTLECSH